MEGGGSHNFYKHQQQQPQGTSPAKAVYINNQQTLINQNVTAQTSMNGWIQVCGFQMLSQNRQMLNYVIPTTNNSRQESKRKNAVQAGYGSMITGNNKQWQPPNNYPGFSQALLGHMMANLPQPTSQRPQQHHQSVSPVQFFHHPYLETGINNNRLGTQRPNFQGPYQPMLPYDSATSRQNNKSATQRRSGTVQGKQRPSGAQENFNTIQEQVPLNLSQFGINPTPNQTTTIVYNQNQRRDLSNPRGFQKQQRVIRQNQDIRETVEAHINGSKGRSKSRRQFPTSNYPQNSLLNTKTIEEYSSGMIDPTYHRAPNNSMLNEQQKHIMIPEAVSNSNLSTIEQRSKKSFSSVSRKKDRPITTANTTLISYPNAYQSIPNNSKPSALDDYIPPSNYPNGVANQIGKVNSDNELERLINEKLNQRYQSRKRQMPEQQTRAESVPKNLVPPYAAQGMPSASFTTAQNKVKSYYSALQESGASSIVNQPQLQSNISLFHQQQPIQNNSSLITRKSKLNNVSNVILPQNNQRNNVSVRKQLISTTQNTQKIVKTRNSTQPEHSNSSHNGGFNTYGEMKDKYNIVIAPPNRYQQPNFDEMQGDFGASQLNLEEIKSQNTLNLGFNDTSVYSNLNCKQEPQVIDSFALDQSPNVHTLQQFYPNNAASYVLKDRQNDNSLGGGINHQQQYHFKSVSKRSIEDQKLAVVKDFDNDSYTEQQVPQNQHSLSPNRGGYIKVSDNNQSIEAFEGSSLSGMQQKRAKSTMRPSGIMQNSGPKNQALIQAFGVNKPQSTDRQSNGIKVLKKPTRAQSQMRSTVRPTVQGKPLPTGKRQGAGSDQQREDYLDNIQQINQTNYQPLSSLPSQNSSTNPKMAPPRNMRIRETPIRVRKGKVILRKNSGDQNNTELLPNQLKSSLGNQSTEMVARSDEQLLQKKQFQMQRKNEGQAEESFVLFQKSNQSIAPGPITVSTQFVRGRRYTLSNNNPQSDEGGSSEAPKQNREFQLVEQDDYFDPKTTTSMINSITKAQAQFKRQFQNSGSINAGKTNNRQNLSKSIILHHNKLGSLLSTVGRYNDILMKEIDDVDENEEDSHIQDNYGEDDDGCVNNIHTDMADDHHAGKLVNSSAAAQSEAQAARYKFPINSNPPHKHFDNFASQVSGQTYDTIQIHGGGQNGAGNVQNNSAHKDFSNMLNTTANKSSILLGDNLCSTSFDPNAPKIAGQSSIQRRTTTLSGSNALLSLLSQDDFTKLKQDIHNHIEKFGGQIEEKAASEEEEESGRSLRSNQKRPQRLADFKETVNHSQMSQNFSDDENHLSQHQQVTNGSGGCQQAPGDDDDDVILKSFRGKKEHNRQDSRANNNPTNKKDQQLISANSVTQIEDIESSCGGDNMIEESPRQNTKYQRTPSITEKP